MNDAIWFTVFMFTSFLFFYLGDNVCTRFVSFFCFIFSICCAVCCAIVGLRYLF